MTTERRLQVDVGGLDGVGWPAGWAVGADSPQVVIVGDEASLRRAATASPTALRVWLHDGPLGAGVALAHAVLPRAAHPAELVMAVDYLLGGDGLAGWSGPKVGDLAPLSKVVKELLDLLQDPNADAKAVERVLSRDPTLAAKVLRVANSPFYALPRRVSSLSQAVMLMGLNGVRVAAIGAGCFDAKGPERDEAEAAREAGVRAMGVVRKLAGAHAGEALTAAMLLDIGRIVMAKVDRSYPKLRAEAFAAGTPIAAAELATYGFHHGLVGAATLAHWGLPSALTRAVALSHTPVPRPTKARSARGLVYVASALTAPLALEVAAPLTDEWLDASGLQDAVKDAALFLEDVAMQAV